MFFFLEVVEQNNRGPGPAVERGAVLGAPRETLLPLRDGRLLDASKMLGLLKLQVCGSGYLNPATFAAVISTDPLAPPPDELFLLLNQIRRQRRISIRGLHASASATAWRFRVTW